MIGAFARKLTRDRMLSLDQVATEAPDAPPERFVDRIPHEGGDVYVSPVLETLRAVLRGRSKKDAEDVEAEATLPRLSEKP